MLEKRTAFTLAEVMITLAVFGLLAAFMMPAITNVRPNKNKVLFKKAYYVAERMVFEIVNDEDFYPSQGDAVGLDNTVVASYLGHTYGGVGNGGEDAKKKFCEIFARKVNTTNDEIKCSSGHAVPLADGTYKTPTFVTTDGISWYLPISNFSSATGEPATETIYVDVNGEKQPNCSYSKTSPGACKTPDIFEIKVDADGKMRVEGDFEKEYLQSNNSLR